MIDRTLNYGRPLIVKYLYASCPFDSVLDIGAGNGTDLLSARRINPASSLFAADAVPENAAELKKQDITVFQINIEKERLPVEDGSIDVVIANQVLEHTKEVFWIFHEISRALSSGGKLILGVPNLASLHNRILLAAGRQPSQIKTCSAHIRGFTKKDLLDFMNSCFPHGYQLMAFGGSNFYPFPPFLAKPLAALFPSLSWGIFFLFRKTRQYSHEYLDYLEHANLETNFYAG